jgi:uncharacterized protein (TIGR00251 family)
MARLEPESERSDKQSWITDRADGAVVSILATPKSNANLVGPVERDELRVRVTARPTDSAANAAIVRTLADATRLPRSNIEIVSGQSSRHKRVLFRGVSSAEILAKLNVGG